MSTANPKYWVANNPNSEITNANSQMLAALSSPAGAFIPVLGPATALPASGSLLVKNTYYAEDTTDGETFLLPTVANSTAGDWIVVQDTAGLANDEKITIGSAANGDFAVGCHLVGINVTSTASTETRDISVAGDNSVVMEGLTNGGGGAGSYVAFVFNGTAWTVTGVSRNIGTGAAITVGAGTMRFDATA
tara:strand:- start:12 stop:584 length:573 start_codon:yes stop_codon:yes gene_type:complete